MDRPIHSKVIADGTGWVQPYYLWLNKNTILTFYGNTDTRVLEGVEEYYLDTGRRRSLDALNKRWLDHEHLYYRIVTQDKEAREQMNYGSFILLPAVSPDGNWIVWFARLDHVGGLPGMWMTASLDGKHWTDYPTELGMTDCVWSLAWSHNSRSWTGLFYDKPAGLVYDVDMQREHPFDFSSWATLPKIQYAEWKMFAQRSNGPLLLTLRNPGYHPNNDVRFADIPWQRVSGAPKQWAIHMPPNAYASEVALSPSGDLLIWNLVFGASGDPPDPPKSAAPPQQEHREIWLSNLDGSQMRRLGDQAFDMSKEDVFFGERGLMGLQWTPDGKHISYIYDRKLYLVSIP